jgi:cysteine-rich repeat protein
MTAALLAAACGGDDARPPRSGSGTTGGDGGGAASGGAGPGGAAGSAATGGEAGIGGAAAGGGEAGAGATSSGGSGAAGSGGTDPGGTGGTAPAPVCGNDWREGTEQCDGPDFGGLRCVDYGFDHGSLMCESDCTVDASACNGVEDCTDGRDNDGDGYADCEDPDCVEACLDGCAAVSGVTLPARLDSTTFGHASNVDSSCAAETGSADVVYAVVAPRTGVLEASISANAALSVSVRTECGGGTELACDFTRASVPVTQGETYYVHVDGGRADTVGAFVLELYVATAQCGNGVRDPGEECDDGNTLPGDGCSQMCTIESDEGEDNDSIETADLYTGPYHGHITLGDVDYIAVVLLESNMSLLAETVDFGDGACDAGLQDSYLEVIAPDQTTVLGFNDDALNLCSRVMLSASTAFGRNLDAGTYYVRVSAPPDFPDETFPYRLFVHTDRCGNGIRTILEQCDDGNTVSGDGCDGSCRLE